MNISGIIEIVSQKLVKPSTSTPPSLRCHNLSLNDQIENSYIPLAFYYPNQGCSTTDQTCQVLEIALSKTLSYYYPFAGRLRDNLFIECNDMGVYFTEARIKFETTEFQNSPMEALVLPNSFLSFHDGTSLLHVQLNYFEPYCGGMAVSICMSHKLGDVSTLCTFIHDWAAFTVNQPNHIPTPQFDVGVSLFPPIEDPSLVKEISMKEIRDPAKHLIFRGPNIAQLKNIIMAATTSGVLEKPTRVEVVTALLYKCAVDSSKEISGSFTPAGLVLPMNLRPITVPPLPKEAVGNISVGLIIPTPKEEEITFPELVSKIRNAKLNIKKEYKEAKSNAATPSIKLAMEQMNHHQSVKQMDLYVCSSWCGFPLYDVDFGGGKPTRVYYPDQGGVKNAFMLRDAGNEDANAIEVVAMLEEPQMSAFVNNKELLAFASLSP